MACFTPASDKCKKKKKGGGGWVFFIKQMTFQKISEYRKKK